MYIPKNTLLRDESKKILSDEGLDQLMNELKSLPTGIQRLNTILSPVYMSKRLYTYLTFPGSGKSQILLKAAFDIRKYNIILQTKDPDKRPAVLFITMENSIDEMIQMLKKLKEDDEIQLTDKYNIDIIIKYYDNIGIDTNDLRGIINDLSDDGVETVALIVDCITKLKPVEKAISEKEVIKNISNELKTLATIEDIPVITAQQLLNRAAASVVDAALQNNKEDVTRMNGREDVIMLREW